MPRLISYPSNLCAFVGEDLEVECTVDYGPSICSELTFRNFIFSDNDHPLITNMNNVRSERRITLSVYHTSTASAVILAAALLVAPFSRDREGKKMKGRLIFSRLTKQQLQQTYSCTVNTHRYLSVTFRLTDGCQDISESITRVAGHPADVYQHPALPQTTGRRRPYSLTGGSER